MSLNARLELEEGALFAGTFRVVRALKRGASVYEVVEVGTGAHVALRVLPPELFGSERARKRFSFDGELIAKVESPYLCRELGRGVDDATGTGWVASELCRGETLAERIRRIGPMPMHDARIFLEQLADALAGAHAQGLVHRDVRASSVVFVDDEDGVSSVKLLDLGLVRLAAPLKAMLGMSFWAAPEELGAMDHASPATDVWCFALLAFYALTGRRFWRAASADARLLREMTIDATPRATYRAREVGLGDRVPAALDPWFRTCLERYSADRFEDVAEALEAFKRALAPVRVPVRGRLVLGLGLVAVLLVGAIGLVRPRASPRAPRLEIRTTTPFAARTRGDDDASASALAFGHVDASAPLAALSTSPPLTVSTSSPFVADSLTTSELVAPAQSSTPAAPPPIAIVAPSSTPAVEAATTGEAKAFSPVDAPMVRFEGSPFRMGSPRGSPDDRPAHEVKVATYFLDVTEVTVAAYQRCADAGLCAPLSEHTDDASLSDGERRAWGRACNGGGMERARHPVNCVSWTQATTYCRAIGRRLPSEAEWEFAARGGRAQRGFVWGEQAPRVGRMNGCGGECVADAKLRGLVLVPLHRETDEWVGTAPAGIFRDGRSAEGVDDLAGNVAEWTDSVFCTYPKHECDDPRRVTRGGGFLSIDANDARSAHRVARPVQTARPDLGFRCAKDGG